MKKNKASKNPLRIFKNNPRTTIGIIIVLSIAGFILKADKPSEYNIVIASLITLIAAMMAHHSATKSSTDKIKKDEADEKNLKRSVIIRAKVLSSEIDDLAGQKLTDFKEKVIWAKEIQQQENISDVKLPLSELYRCKFTLPTDFKFVREHIGLIPSNEAINCIARLSFIIELLNTHISCEIDSMDAYIGYMGCVDKLENDKKEKIKMSVLENISETLFSQHTNRISSILEELKSCSNQLNDLLIEINEND